MDSSIKRYPNDDEHGPFLVTTSNGNVYGDINYYKDGYAGGKVQSFYRWDSEMWKCFDPDVIACVKYLEPYKGDEDYV